VAAASNLSLFLATAPEHARVRAFPRSWDRGAPCAAPDIAGRAAARGGRRPLPRAGELRERDGGRLPAVLRLLRRRAPVARETVPPPAFAIDLAAALALLPALRAVGAALSAYAVLLLTYCAPIVGGWRLYRPAAAPREFLELFGAAAAVVLAARCFDLLEQLALFFAEAVGCFWFGKIVLFCILAFVRPVGLAGGSGSMASGCCWSSGSSCAWPPSSHSRWRPPSARRSRRWRSRASRGSSMARSRSSTAPSLRSSISQSGTESDVPRFLSARGVDELVVLA
jgi:hypothetical protein